jgi:hypothetical protein
MKEHYAKLDWSAGGQTEAARETSTSAMDWLQTLLVLLRHEMLRCSAINVIVEIGGLSPKDARGSRACHPEVILGGCQRPSIGKMPCGRYL